MKFKSLRTDVVGYTDWHKQCRAFACYNHGQTAVHLELASQGVQVHADLTWDEARTLGEGLLRYAKKVVPIDD